MTTQSISGATTSPIAGPILRRGAPVRQDDVRGVCTSDPRDGFVWVVWDDPALEHPGPRSEPVEQVHLDLDDEVGQAIATRWLGKHHKMRLGVSGPTWEPTVIGWANEPAWLLAASRGDGPALVFVDGDNFGDPHWRTVLGISAETPAGALHRACVEAGA